MGASRWIVGMGPEVAAALCQGIVLLLVIGFGFGRLCLGQDTFGIPN